MSKYGDIGLFGLVVVNRLPQDSLKGGDYL
jgi:hypothetical protein